MSNRPNDSTPHSGPTQDRLLRRAAAATRAALEPALRRTWSPAARVLLADVLDTAALLAKDGPGPFRLRGLHTHTDEFAQTVGIAPLLHALLGREGAEALRVAGATADAFALPGLYEGASWTYARGAVEIAHTLPTATESAPAERLWTLHAPGADPALPSAAQPLPPGQATRCRRLAERLGPGGCAVLLHGGDDISAHERLELRMAEEKGFRTLWIPTGWSPGGGWSVEAELGGDVLHLSWRAAALPRRTRPWLRRRFVVSFTLGDLDSPWAPAPRSGDHRHG